MHESILRLLALLADRIEEHYVHPEVAATIAAQLRNWQPSVADPPALVAEVKALLRGHDRHLSLRWLPGAGDEGADRPVSPLDDPESRRRMNHGFRQVGMLDGGIALLELSLVCDTDDPAALAAAQAALAGTANADAVIVDLRRVPGGWPSGGTLLLGHFLPPQPTHLLTLTARYQEPEQCWTPADNPLGHRPDIPLFLLIGPDTASAGEAFAYAAQSLGRGVVIGQPSAGAANPGDFFALTDGFSAFIPTMAPVDPRTGTNWEGSGVRPDVTTAPEQALTTAQQLARRMLGAR
ncbi:S41 family peptidase [Kitasatospora mediocidica]|uniref:S41 family peptidase n=1 Tax=Kitasatospora mediocidica TaxID=58352 RepID=UPI000567A542|nr:S41 family peptidase [Kitasatospora mediocidica]